MQEIISWIDRENARLDFIVKGSNKGGLMGFVCCLVVRYLRWRDPVPASLREAMDGCD
jgi:hypothetical protein